MVTFCHSFPTHALRGIEAYTLVLEGEVHYRNNLNDNVIVKKGGLIAECSGSGLLSSKVAVGVSSLGM